METLRKIKTVRFSSHLDKKVSVAEYSIYDDGFDRYAKMIIFNSSSVTVYQFKMKITAFDDKNIKLNTTILDIKNIVIRPGLYLELKTKVPLPPQTDGFNYETISINTNTTPSGKNNFSKKSSELNFVLPSEQISIKNTDIKSKKDVNILRKVFLKAKSSIFVPLIAIGITLLTTIYFDSRVNFIQTSTVTDLTPGPYQLANRNDFDFDYENETLVLRKYKDKKDKIYIDPGAFVEYKGQRTIIGSACFANSRARRVVVKGNCYIENNAFYNATNLESFICTNYTVYYGSFDGELIDIGDSAFENCKSLVTVSCQTYSGENINANVFKNCTSLRDFVIASHIKIIKEGAFYGCKGLESIIEIPESVTHIESQAFLESNIKTVVFKNSLTEKQDDSFNSGTRLIGSSLYRN